MLSIQTLACPLEHQRVQDEVTSWGEWTEQAPRLLYAADMILVGRMYTTLTGVLTARLLPTHGELTGLWVNPSCRRLGIGSALWRQAKRRRGQWHASAPERALAGQLWLRATGWLAGRGLVYIGGEEDGQIIFRHDGRPATCREVPARTQ